MLAIIQPAKSGFKATFERYYGHAVEDVWAYLTDNEKLKQWFAELHVEELREGGVIKFDMQDGTFEEMAITSFAAGSVLAYTWGEDHVRFELFPEPKGCKLLLIEEIARITSHTPRDLAGWHVCLEVIRELLDGQPVEPRKPQWEGWYEQYKALTERIVSQGQQ